MESLLIVCEADARLKGDEERVCAMERKNKKGTGMEEGVFIFFRRPFSEGLTFNEETNLMKQSLKPWSQ